MLLKNRTILGAVFILALAVVVTIGGQVLSQEPEAPSPEDMQEMMEKWLATTQPGTEHAALEAFIGKWKTTMKGYWEGPGSDPVVTHGTSEARWVLGGRFIIEEFHGQMIMPDENGGFAPVPLEGISTTGYDKFRKLYVNTWMDNHSTALFLTKGTASPDGKAFFYYGEMDEPMLDMVGRMVKMKITVESNDKHVMEMFDLAAGENYKVMEIVYERMRETGDDDSDENN